MFDSSQTIEQFFTNLSMMELDKCQALLDQLDENAKPQSTDALWVLYLRGILYNERDRDWSTSERLFRSLLQRELPTELAIRVQNALANTYQYLGRWQDALQIYDQILAQSSPSADNFEKAKIWKNMAIAIEIGFSNRLFQSTHLELARDYCDSAITAIANSAENNEAVSWLEATVWNTRGLIMLGLQEWNEAQRCFEQFMALSESLDDQYSVADAKHNMGEVYQKMGDPTAAQAMYNEAQTIYQQFDDSYRISEILVNQAMLHYDQTGDTWANLERAINAIEQAAQLSESIRVRLTAPYAQMGYRATTEKLYRTLISVSLARNDPSAAFSAAERARSRVLADLLLGQRPSVSTDVPLELIEERAHIVEKITQFGMFNDEQGTVFELESRLGEIDRQIELFDPNFALFDSVQSLTTVEVQKALPLQSVLLSYTIDVADHMWITLITPTEILHKKVEGITATWLSAFLSDHVDGVRRGALVPDPSGSLSSPTLFPLLYKALIEPVAGFLDAVEKIYIVPTGPLHYLPLGALIAYAGSTKSNKHQQGIQQFVYGPSATVLFQFCRQRQRSLSQHKLIVAPNDDQLAHTVDFAEQKQTSPLTQTLNGTEATRSAFVEQAGKYHVLCFLGHAVFDQHHPMSSRLKLVDGDLRASEIIRELRLDADLVMLSACETGRNKILAGDELLGLTRALFYAGTPSVLTTLWPVHEVPTLLVVNKILQQIDASDQGQSSWDPAKFLAHAQSWLRSLSFSDAQEALLALGLNKAHSDSLDAVWKMTHPNQPPLSNDHPFEHPFFWAPYILVGEST